MTKVRYTMQLRPSKTAEQYLNREWDNCRYVWNQLVQKSNDVSQENLERLKLDKEAELVTFSYKEQSKFLTHLRATTINDETKEHWLANGTASVQAQTVRDYSRARSKALMDRKNKLSITKQKGLPRYKSKYKSNPSMNHTRGRFKIQPHPETGKNALVLPGKVIIPVVWSRELPSEPSSVRVYRDSVGHWYASFVVEIVLPETRNSSNIAIGVDWGVKETATTARVNLETGEVNENTEYDLPHAQHGKTHAQKLARYQRMMTRRSNKAHGAKKGMSPTKGYKEARKLVAKTHKKIANKRVDDARKWAHKVARDNDKIAVEDFKPKFLSKSTMAKKAADARIAITKAELIWQAKKNGSDLRLVNPSFTTMDCSSCGARAKHHLNLGERMYSCESCGLVRSRDKNSAIIMVARAGFNPASVESVRLLSDIVQTEQLELKSF